ncbi:DUF362 domain-containing protein [Desulfogranum japonicum]|uniref:DUF362 domain-containing protein n=1 Tax=Desulfogranum japonicum TaxID=231447 RepID=UPI00040447C8|nr:DUF362 domain-containing protein [Desulfogranum japonicum]
MSSYNQPEVFLAKVTEYTSADFYPSVKALLEHTVNPKGLNGQRVMLKPNLISAKGGNLACTHPEVILAVARWFLENGARVQVGDSPAFGTAETVLDSLQVASTLRTLGVQIVNFNRGVSKVLPGGMQVKVAAAAVECDLLVNLPKCKAHAQARITLAMKNYYGCVVGLRKAWAHMQHGGKNGRFAELVVQLPSVLAPSVSLMDGIIAMHRTGPVHGVAFPAGVMAAAQNAVALDTVLMGVLNITPQSCPLWVAASELGMEGTAAGPFQWLTGEPQGYIVKDFEVPSVLMPIRFNPFRFIRSSVRRVLLSRKSAE